MDSEDILKFRNAKSEDCEKVFEWINDPLVRRNSYNSEEIPFEEHKKWFDNKIKDENIIYLIFEYDKKPAGQIRIERKDENVIGILISSEFRGKSLAPEMLIKASQEFKKKYPDEIITAYIKYDNIPSLKSFEKAGFVIKDEKEINGSKSYILTK